MGRWALCCGSMVAALVSAATSNAGGEVNAITVPWLGSPAAHHQVDNGGTLTLQGVAILPPGAAVTGATWDPDGPGPAGPIPIADVSNPRVLELDHTYSVPPGSLPQVFNAVLDVQTDCCGSDSDEFRVIVRSPSLQVDVNMAIDHGLWNLHKRMTVAPGPDGAPVGFWDQPNRLGVTGSAVQAFQINNHLESGNPDEDPYVHTVAQGLRHLFIMLNPQPIGPEPAGNPDSNGNGIALLPNDPNPGPALGAVLQAIATTDTPNAIAMVGDPGSVAGRPYQDIAQDMMDAYSWGQTDAGPGRGGWHYTYDQQSADGSTSQWMGIAGLAAEARFGLTTPRFVIDENEFQWIPFSQLPAFPVGGPSSGSNGVFVHDDTQQILSNGVSDTASGLVQMIWNDTSAPEARFDAAARYLCRNAHSTHDLINQDLTYGMFTLSRAMRLAQPGPIQTLVCDTNDDGSDDGSWSWYGGGLGQPIGVAGHLVNTQLPDGSWTGNPGPEQPFVFPQVPDTHTAWSVSTLWATDCVPEPVEDVRISAAAGSSIVDWTPGGGSIISLELESSFDVVRGDLGTLVTTGSYTLAVGACLANDVPTSMAIDGDPLPPGSGFWYLVRENGCLAPGSYGSAATDAALAASPNSCP